MGKVKGTYDLSYWERSTFFHQLDVVVIGSGLVGLNAAIHLKERNPFLKIAILERGPLPIGASTRNAGFACFGSVTELMDDIEHFGEDRVWNLVEMRYLGLQKLMQRYSSKKLEYHAWGGYELFRKEKDLEKYQKAVENLPYFNKVLKTITRQHATFLPVDHQIKVFGFNGVDHMLLNQAEGQLNTGKLMQVLLNHAQHLGISIFNGIKVKNLESHNGGVQLLTNKEWNIKARRVIIATNGFTKQLLGELEVQPARNQVLITKPIPGLPIKGTFHFDRGYYYFRNVGNRILIGGGRNLALEKEATDKLGTTPFIRGVLTKVLKEYILPDTSYEADLWWSGIMGVGHQKLPLVQKVDDHVFVGVRLGGMGVAIGSIIGEQVAQLVLDEI